VKTVALNRLQKGYLFTLQYEGRNKKSITLFDLTWEWSHFILRKLLRKGTGVAQSVKHPTLDFASGHDLSVVKSSLTVGPVLPAWDSLSRPLPHP